MVVIRVMPKGPGFPIWDMKPPKTGVKNSPRVSLRQGNLKLRKDWAKNLTVLARDPALHICGKFLGLQLGHCQK